MYRALVRRVSSTSSGTVLVTWLQPEIVSDLPKFAAAVDRELRSLMKDRPCLSPPCTTPALVAEAIARVEASPERDGLVPGAHGDLDLPGSAHVD